MMRADYFEARQRVKNPAMGGFCRLTAWFRLKRDAASPQEKPLTACAALNKMSVPAADLRAGFLQMMLERRLFVVRAISQAGPQEVERMPRTIGVQGNQSQVPTFLVRGRLQGGQTMLHHPGRRPVRLAGVEHLEIIQHANHDGPRADRLERDAQVGSLESDALAEPPAALVSRKDPCENASRNSVPATDS